MSLFQLAERASRKLTCRNFRARCAHQLLRYFRLEPLPEAVIFPMEIALPPILLVTNQHHSRRPRERSCNSMKDSSSCARFNPARPLLELLIRSLSIRRSAAATRSRARSKSTTVYCRGSGRMRFGDWGAHRERSALCDTKPKALPRVNWRWVACGWRRDPDVGVSATTVGELRKVTAWP